MQWFLLEDDDVEVRVAQAAGGDLDEHLAGLGAGGADGLDLKALVVVKWHQIDNNY